jgi:hypothetical protein
VDLKIIFLLLCHRSCWRNNTAFGRLLLQKQEVSEKSSAKYP